MLPAITKDMVHESGCQLEITFHEEAGIACVLSIIYNGKVYVAHSIGTSDDGQYMAVFIEAGKGR